MIDLFAKWPAGWSRQGRSTLAIALGVVLLMLVLSFIDVPLAHLPEPIGSSAEQFAEGSRTTVMLTLVSGVFSRNSSLEQATPCRDHLCIRLRATFWWRDR